VPLPFLLPSATLVIEREVLIVGWVGGVGCVGGVGVCWGVWGGRGGGSMFTSELLKLRMGDYVQGMRLSDGHPSQVSGPVTCLKCIYQCQLYVPTETPRVTWYIDLNIHLKAKQRVLLLLLSWMPSANTATCSHRTKQRGAIWVRCNVCRLTARWSCSQTDSCCN